MSSTRTAISSSSGKSRRRSSAWRSRRASDIKLDASGAASGIGGIERRGTAGLNYYGVASFWMRKYGTARGVLDAACQFAVEETGTAAATFQPLTKACFSEVLRATDSQMEGHRFDASDLERRVTQARDLARAGVTGNLLKGSADAGMFLLEFESCFLASRTGRSAEADAHYLGCLERASKLPRSSWMWALVWWARLERAKAAGELREAAVSANAMVAMAQTSEHVPLKALADVLRADIHRDTAPAA